VVVATVLPGGVALFRQEAVRNHISYAVPWIALTLTLGCYLTIIPRICVLEGIGQLRRVQRMRLIQAAVSTACLWSLVPVAGSLTAIAVASIANLLVAAAWLAVSFPAAVRAGPAEQAAPIAAPTSGTSVMRAQNRSAASWIIGFLGPQLLSPIVFRFQGAAAAGQVGLSLAAATAPLMVSLSWLQARYPEYGGLVARGELDLLDSTAKRATAQALAVCGVSIVVLLLLVLWVQLFFARLGSRFLPIGGVAALCLTSIVYLLYQAMAGHLRAHREESLLWPIALGTSASIAATIAAARYGPMAAALSYSASVIGVLLPASIVGFVRRRRLLHFAHARDRQSGWESLPPSEESTPNGP
jgi:hypothetical protein